QNEDTFFQTLYQEVMMLVAISAIHQQSGTEIGLLYALFFTVLALFELGIELFALINFCVTFLGKL
ncbi:TPA: hypothetical protein ACIEO1_004847, partial [Escherichia coli]